MQTASGEGEGDKTPNVGDSMVLGVEQVGVSNRVWELGELVRFGNWVFLFFFIYIKFGLVGRLSVLVGFEPKFPPPIGFPLTLY